MAVSSGPSGVALTIRAVWRSCAALLSQSRVSQERLSAIELPASCKNLVLQGCLQILVTIKFLPRLHKHVLAHAKSPQTTMRPLHPANGPIPALRDDHHEVHVAVFMRRAPGVRTKQINLLRLKFSFQ